MELDAVAILQILATHESPLVREAVKAAQWQALAEALQKEPDGDDSV